MVGRYPTYDVLSQTSHWDEVTRARRPRPRRERPADPSSSRTPRRARSTRSATSSPRRTTSRASPCSTTSTRSCRRGSATAGATSTCPTTTSSGGSSRAGSTSRRPTTPTTRSRTRRSRRRSGSCTASRKATCTAACGSTVNLVARVLGPHALRRAGVLLASVGVERDRLRRPRLPARLRRVRLAAPRRGGELGGATSRRTTTRCATCASGGSIDARQGQPRDAARQRLGVPARPAQARPPEPRPHGALPATRRRSTC